MTSYAPSARGDEEEVQPLIGQRAAPAPQKESSLRVGPSGAVGLTCLLVFMLVCFNIVLYFSVFSRTPGSAVGSGSHAKTVTVAICCAVFYFLAMAVGALIMRTSMKDVAEKANEQQTDGGGATHAVSPSGAPGAFDPGGDDDDDARHGEMRQELWDELEGKERPEIFNLTIAKDGGLTSEISSLGEHDLPLRIFGACMLVFFCGYNIFSIFQVDLDLIFGDQSKHDQFMFIPYVFDGAVNLMLEAMSMKGDFKLPGVPLLASAELFYLTFIIGTILYHVWEFTLGRSGWRKWLALSEICWEHMPQIAVFSAMGCLYYIQPLVLSQHIANYLSTIHPDASGNIPKRKMITALLRFAVTRGLAGIVGVDAFLMKFRAVSAHIMLGTMGPSDMMKTVMFVVQLLGVSKLGIFTKERLFMFIFAGEDAVMMPSELAKQDIFNALLVRKIWEKFDFPKKWIILLSFSDADFQQMVLNEEAVRAGNVEGSGP